MSNVMIDNMNALAETSSSSSSSSSFQTLVTQGQELTELWNNTPVPDRPLSEEALDVLYTLGMRALHAKQYTEAQVAFATLLQHLPAHADYLSGMAHALGGHGDAAGAVLLHALALQSAALEDKASHALSLAQAFIDVRQPDAAEAILNALPSNTTALPLFKQLQARTEAVRALIHRASH